METMEQSVDVRKLRQECAELPVMQDKIREFQKEAFKSYEYMIQMFKFQIIKDIVKLYNDGLDIINEKNDGWLVSEATFKK